MVGHKSKRTLLVATCVILTASYLYTEPSAVADESKASTPASTDSSVDKATSYFEQATAAEQDRDFAKAAKFYKALMRNDKYGERSVEGFVRSASKLRNLDEPEQTLNILVNERNPFSAAGHLALAEVYSAQDRLDEALEKIAVFEKLRPDSADAQNLKISLLMRSENYQAVIMLTSELLRRNPTDEIELRHQRGIAFFKTKAFAQAAADLEVVNRSKNRPRSVIPTLLKCYTAMGNDQLAEDTAKEWTAVEPKSYLAWEALGDVITKKKPMEAIAAYEKSATFNADDFNIRAKITDIYFNMKDWPKTETTARIALKLDPGNDKVAKQLVVALKSTQQLDALGKFLKGYAEDQPDQVWATVAYIQVLNEVGLSSLAASFVESPLMTKTDPNSLAASAFILVAANRVDDAIAKLTSAVKRTPTDLLYFNLGLVYEFAGKTAEGAAAYGRVPTASPIWQKAQFNRALLQERTGQIDNAIATLKNVQEKNPGQQQIESKLAALESQKANPSSNTTKLSAKSFSGSLPYRQWEFAP